MRDAERFQRAIAAIDAMNASDPQRVSVRDMDGPKEMIHARLASEWVARLVREPSEALLLAARAHHVRRWQVPRSTQPAGRAGYLRWREGLYEFHAQTCAGILEAEGYAGDEIGTVTRLIRKSELRTDPEAQALEDALCLVFLETQARDFAAKEPDKVKRVLARTLSKMSAEGRAAARVIELEEGIRALLDELLSKA
jgi:hypothetical protein